MGVKFGNKVIDKIYIGDREIDKVFLGDKEVYSAISFEGPSFFIDTSGSPGSPTPINDLDGNPMFDEAKGIAYYGTVSHTDLYKADEFSSLIGVTQGTGSSDANIDEEAVWHKYYWNGGIHFWRKPIRRSVSRNAISNTGALLGTGTTTSRKGRSDVGSTVQDAEVTKNGVTYIVRVMETGITEPTPQLSGLHGSEFNLILLNLHAATNSGEYSEPPTDGVSYASWSGNSGNFTNDDFVAWKTNLNDSDFGIEGNGGDMWQQETRLGFSEQERWFRGSSSGDALAGGTSDIPSRSNPGNGWAPVLTVKHPSFATYGKTGGFNQNEPDW